MASPLRQCGAGGRADVVTQALQFRRFRIDPGAVLFIAALASVCGAMALFVGTLLSGPSRRPDEGLTAPWLAAMLYTASHGLRVIRLTVLAGDPRVSLRQLGLVHLLTAAVSMMTPFKLGEIYRITELGHLLRNTGYALIVVWIERAFDFAAITLLILLAYAAQPAILSQIQPLVVMAVLFVAATIALFTIVPEGLGTLSLFVLRRYDGNGAIGALRALQWLRQGITLGPRFIAGKVPTLLVLTLGIWGLELATFSAMTTGAERHLRGLVTGLPLFLSSESLGGGFLHPSGPHWQYRLVITGTLLALGVIAALLYAPARLRGALALGSSRVAQSRMRRPD